MTANDRNIDMRDVGRVCELLGLRRFEVWRDAGGTPEHGVSVEMLRRVVLEKLSREASLRRYVLEIGAREGWL